MSKNAEITLALLRISLGCIFFWAFVDKVFGLGFATTSDKSWLAGVSPTSGFLTHGTSGPLAQAFSSLAGNPLVDWLFMLGLLGIGLALTLGIGLKIAAIAGTIQMLLIYAATFPPQNNPVIDEHIIYILVLWLLYFIKAGNCYGLGCKWEATPLIENHPWLT